MPWGLLDARKRVIYVLRALWGAQKRVFYEGLFARVALFVAQVRCFCLAAKVYFSSSGRGVFHAFLRVARFRGEIAMHFYLLAPPGVAECMHFYGVLFRLCRPYA